MAVSAVAGLRPISGLFVEDVGPKLTTEERLVAAFCIKSDDLFVRFSEVDERSRAFITPPLQSSSSSPILSSGMESVDRVERVLSFERDLCWFIVGVSKPA